MKFDGFFRATWQKEAEHPVTFDNEYLKNLN